MSLHRAWLTACLLVVLSACGSEAPDKGEVSLQGERYPVLLGKDDIEPDAIAKSSPIDVPEPRIVPEWSGNMAHGLVAHMAIHDFNRHNSAKVGDGYGFSSSIAPAPIASNDTIFAMDAAGHISAHAINDIDTMRWLSPALSEPDTQEMIGGGLFLDKETNTLYAASGYGKLVALDAATGTEKWSRRMGAPIRGAPSASAAMVVVITANNETIALRAADGETMWEHRGIRESAGFFSTVSPVIWQGTVLVAYSSGEVFAFTLETGSVIWTDTLITDNRTQAAAAFTGVNATPLVQDGVAYLISASGSMVANAVLNGRPLWEAKIGSSHRIWGAGNMVFVLTTRHRLVAVLKHTGKVHWVADLSSYNDNGFDITPNQFAPMLINGHVCVADVKGNLFRINVLTGERATTLEVDDDLATAPISVNGQLITLHKNAVMRVTSP